MLQSLLSCQEHKLSDDVKKLTVRTGKTLNRDGVVAYLPTQPYKLSYPQTPQVNPSPYALKTLSLWIYKVRENVSRRNGWYVLVKLARWHNPTGCWLQSYLHVSVGCCTGDQKWWGMSSGTRGRFLWLLSWSRAGQIWVCVCVRESLSVKMVLCNFLIWNLLKIDFTLQMCKRERSSRAFIMRHYIYIHIIHMYA